MYNKTTANEIRVYQEIAEAKDPISEFTSDFHGTRSEDGKHHKAFPLIASKNLVFFRSDDSHRLWAIAFLIRTRLHVANSLSLYLHLFRQVISLIRYQSNNLKSEI